MESTIEVVETVVETQEESNVIELSAEVLDKIGGGTLALYF